MLCGTMEQEKILSSIKLFPIDENTVIKIFGPLTPQKSIKIPASRKPTPREAHDQNVICFFVER